MASGREEPGGGESGGSAGVLLESGHQIHLGRRGRLDPIMGSMGFSSTGSLLIGLLGRRSRCFWTVPTHELLWKPIRRAHLAVLWLTRAACENCSAHGSNSSG